MLDCGLIRIHLSLGGSEVGSGEAVRSYGNNLLSNWNNEAKSDDAHC